MDLLYGTGIPQSSLNDIIKATEEIIRVKQICKDQLPSKCGRQVNTLLSENFHNVMQESQQKPLLDNKYQVIFNIKSDNRTPMKLKFKKNQGSEIAPQRLSFDSKSFRKSSAVKSRRDQCTASTNRKKLDDFSKTYDGSFLQDRPWTQTQCRKRFSKTANVSPREKYFELKDENKDNSFQDEQRRKDLKERRLKQKLDQQKIHLGLIKLSYQRRALQQEFENAKVGQKKFSLNKDKEVNQIVNYEIENGSILTNRFKKPFRKTIQNIINLEYEERTRQRILRRKSQRQYEVQSNNKNKKQNQEQQRQKAALMNSQYNNSGRRQTSLIPYVTINPGVSLSESSIQASISRARPSQQLSRQKFFSSIQNKNFRSYSKDVSPQKIQKQMMTIDVCEKNRASKTTLNNETKDSFRKSILWGSKTSRQGHRIRLVKQDFLKQFAD